MAENCNVLVERPGTGEKGEMAYAAGHADTAPRHRYIYIRVPK
jgi:hypothetical protein